MRKYRITLKADNGRVKFSVVTKQGLSMAIKLALKATGAPESAIIKITVKDLM